MLHLHQSTKWLLICAITLLTAGRAPAMSSEELRQLYLDVVESAVEVYEPIWVDDSERIPNSGFFDYRKYGNWRDEPYATIIVIPGTGMVDFCYSVLLTETDKETFSKLEIPREVLLDRIIKSIRWCCLTSTYVDNPYPYLPNTRPEFLVGENWRREYSYRADEVGWLTMAAANVWSMLDDETKGLMEDIMIGGAPKERIVKTWTPGGQGGNHDQVKQDLSSTIGSAFLFPERADRGLYMDIVRGNSMDMVSTLHDYACNTIADGKPIHEWSRGWNLYQDYSSDHHGWCNIWYGNDLLFEGWSYVGILSAMNEEPIPETFTYPGNGFENVLEWVKVLGLPPGEPASVHGNEYDTYYGAGLLAYCYGNVIKNDPVAAAFERRAAQLLKRHSGAVRQYDYHRNSWAKAATALLMHKYHGPGVEPLPYEEAARKLDGVYHYRWHQDLIHRSPEKWASFAWGTISSRGRSGLRIATGLCGIIVPGAPISDETEPLVYCHPRSLIGDVDLKDADGADAKRSQSVRYTHASNDRGFHTAGVVQDGFLDRFYAFYSFDDGPCALLTKFHSNGDGKLSWSGLPVCFYWREGMTPQRTLTTANGNQPLGEETTQESAWWCVDGRLGLVQFGGNASLHSERETGYNWARIPEYRDKSDTVFVSPMDGVTVHAGETIFEHGAIIYPDTKAESIARAAESMTDETLALPDGWYGKFMPDAERGVKRYLAAANFNGAAQDAPLALTTDLGAPVFQAPAVISGKTSRLSLHLEPLESFGGDSPIFIQANGGGLLQISPESANRYSIEPFMKDSVSVTLQVVRKDIQSVRFLGLKGKVLQEFPAAKDGKPAAIQYTIQQPIVLELVSGNADRIGPSVEISEVIVREDGEAAITVAAADTSGIASVELFRGGASLGARNEPPYVWHHNPEPGYHTFRAVAVDGSPAANSRESFKRTVSTAKAVTGRE